MEDARLETRGDRTEELNKDNTAGRRHSPETLWALPHCAGGQAGGIQGPERRSSSGAHSPGGWGAELCLVGLSSQSVVHRENTPC